MLLQMTELLIYFQIMYMFLQSPLLWAGDAVEDPRARFIQTLFSSLNFNSHIFTANTKSNPKVMTGMNCWTEAGTEVASGAAPGSWEMSDPPRQQELGAQGDSFSFLLRGSPECCSHAVTSSALLLRTCLQRLSRAFHLLLLWFEGSHLCSVLFCVDIKSERATANSKDKRAKRDSWSAPRFSCSTGMARLLRSRGPPWFKEVPAGCTKGLAELQGSSGHTPQGLTPDAGSPAVLPWSWCSLRAAGEIPMPTVVGPPGQRGSGSCCWHRCWCNPQQAPFLQPGKAGWVGSRQAQLGQPGSTRWTPNDSYFSPDLGSVLALLGLCHLMLLLKVSPQILMWAACLAYLMLLSVGSNLIYQIDSILFQWVIFHLPLVKLFPRFPRALYWARCYFVFICCHWVILFISVE